MFIDEFMDFASMLIPDHINNIFIGDFNLHVSDPNDTDSAIFNDTIEAMGLPSMWVNLHTSQATC